MEIERIEIPEYIPLKLKLTFNTLKEEKDFISIIDKVDAYRSRSVAYELTPGEYFIINKISNWFTGNGKY